MTPSKIDKFFAALAKDRPEPKGELKHVNAYTLLVAVVLSAQMTDAGVNKATVPLFKKVKTPKAMLKLGVDGVREYIKSVNLFNNKAKFVIGLSQKLVDEFGGKVPQDRDALESLPGVGRKTANVVLSIAFGQSTIAVDTHVFRVANRTGLALAKTPNAVEAKLLKVIPDKWLYNAHHWMILHGRYVCKARKPDCPNCVVRGQCAFKDKTKA